MKIIKISFTALFILSYFIPNYAQSVGFANQPTSKIPQRCLGQEKQITEPIISLFNTRPMEWDWPINRPRRDPNPNRAVSTQGDNEILLNWYQWPLEVKSTILGVIQKRDFDQKAGFETITYRQILPDCDDVRKSVIANLVKGAFYGKVTSDFTWKY